MKRLMLIFVGILFLLTDIRVDTGAAYPEYEILEDDFYANGKKTQAMVMYDVVGTSLKADILPDAVGFVLLAFAGKTLFSDEQKKKRNTFLLSALAALAASLLIPFAPFFLGGETIYALEYFLGWLCPFFEYLTLFLIVRAMMEKLECKQNHRDNILIWIGVLASIFCGFIADMTGFFQLGKTSAVYTVLELVFTVCYGAKLVICTKQKESENEAYVPYGAEGAAE